VKKDKKLTKKEIKTLQDGLREMRRRAFLRAIKEERKLWASLDDSPTFHDLLSRLTKEELYAICSSLKLKGMSALNKSELIAGLEKQFSARLPRLFNLLDETRYKILKKMSNRGGRTYFPTDPQHLVYFKRRGLIFTGMIDEEKVLITPPEVLDVFRQIDGDSYREKVRKNTELIQFTQGLLFYYGTLSLAEYQDMLQNHLDVPYTLVEIMDLLEDAQAFHQTFRFDAEGISEYRVLNSREIKEEHRARPDLPFYPFTKAQLLRAGEPGFVDRNFSFRAFVRFIQENYIIGRDEAELIVEECVEGVVTGQSLQEILEYLQVHLEIPNLELLNKIASHLVELMNNTKQWILKGYSPYEISPRGRTSVQPKVSRNAPCPCGSGKKYKRCCGNA
jgi:hypothetical protein